MFDRDDAFNGEIIDPDGIDNSNICALKTINDDLYLLKKKSMYVMELASTVDPENKYPNKKHTYRKIASLGEESYAIGRIMYQFEEIIKTGLSNKPLQKKSFDILLKSVEHLIILEEIVFKTKEEVERKEKLAEDIMKKHINSSIIPALPVIYNLENVIDTFFENIKYIMIDVFKLFSTYLNINLGGDYSEAKFDKHFIKIESILGVEHCLTIGLKKILNDVRFYAEIRNAITHPKENLNVNIFNFKIIENNKILCPSITYDLSLRLEDKIIKEPENISYFLFKSWEFALYFFEDIFSYVLSSEMNPMIEIYKTEEDLNNIFKPILSIKLKDL
jgi:hypothetical protein